MRNDMLLTGNRIKCELYEAVYSYTNIQYYINIKNVVIL